MIPTAKPPLEGANSPGSLAQLLSHWVHDQIQNLQRRSPKQTLSVWAKYHGAPAVAPLQDDPRGPDGILDDSAVSKLEIFRVLRPYVQLARHGLGDHSVEGARINQRI